MAVVLVVTSAPPLAEGGHLVIARALERALIEAGHEASIITTPSNRFGRQGSAYVANWLTDVGMTGAGKRVDQVITLRFPSFAVRHPNQVCWLNHTMREYYDLWDGFAAGLSPQGRLKERLRRAVVHRADTYFLKHHVRRLFAQSRTVQARIEKWNRLPSTVLHPPAPPRAYRTDGYGDFFLFASRLTKLKRADLFLRALAEPHAAGARGVIVGEGDEMPRLRTLAHDLGLEPRVRFAGYVDDATLLDYLATCRAVVFVPKDEDYGFVTAEAFASGKAVITASDSGGPCELVRDGDNGFIVEPAPRAIAEALQRLMDSPSDAERMGRAAVVSAHALNWPSVVAQLTSPN